MKSIIALTTTAVGGGVIAGVTSSLNSSSSTNETSLDTGLEREETSPTSQALRQESEGVVTKSQDPQPQESNSISSASQEETLRTQEAQTWNCVVEKVPEKVSKQLPKGIVYVAFFCKNDPNKTSLEDWKGYFPSDLLIKTPNSFKDGDRVNIDVTDKNGEEEQTQEVELDSEDEGDPTWTVFKSDQFKPHTIIGNWGCSTTKDDLEDEEESDDEGETIYRVSVSGPTGANRFYLQWL